MNCITLNISSEKEYFFKSHIAHLIFVNDFLLLTQEVKIDNADKIKILEKLSQLLVKDYIFNEEFKQKVLSFGEEGEFIYSELMKVYNIQIAYCGQIGSDQNRLNESTLILKQLSK